MSPEAWLTGPIEGVPPLLMPVAHSLVEARAELRIVEGISTERVWADPGGAATLGFHLKHVPGAIDRLLTYADGGSLTDEQMAYLRAEKEPGDPPADAATLLAGVDAAVDRALHVVRTTDEATLLEHRPVGRAQLPSNVLGLLFHIAEHTQRHVGQVVTTVRLLDQRRA